MPARVKVRARVRVSVRVIRVSEARVTFALWKS